MSDISKVIEAVSDKLDEIIETQEEHSEKLDRLEEAIQNISTPGGNYTIEYEQE